MSMITGRSRTSFM